MTLGALSVLILFVEAFPLETLIVAPPSTGALSALMLQGMGTFSSLATDAFSVLMLPGLKLTFLNALTCDELLLAFADLDDPVEPLLIEFFSVIAFNTVFPGLFGLCSTCSVITLQHGLYGLGMFAPLRTEQTQKR
jgi:hypothetical protein